MINPPGRTQLGKYLASVCFHPGSLFYYAVGFVLISPMSDVTAQVKQLIIHFSTVLRKLVLNATAPRC